VAEKLRQIERDGDGRQQHERDEDNSASLTLAPVLPTRPPGGWCGPTRLGARTRPLLRGGPHTCRRRRAFALRRCDDRHWLRVGDRLRPSGGDEFLVVEEILERLERIDVREGNPRPRVGVRVTRPRRVDNRAPRGRTHADSSPDAPRAGDTSTSRAALPPTRRGRCPGRLRDGRSAPATCSVIGSASRWSERVRRCASTSRSGRRERPGNLASACR